MTKDKTAAVGLTFYIMRLHIPTSHCPSVPCVVLMQVAAVALNIVFHAPKRRYLLQFIESYTSKKLLCSNDIFLNQK